MKINVGDYVRLKDGVIRKITDIEPVGDGTNNYYVDETYVNRFHQECNCMSKNCIKGKPSPNIIDLIEVGDYVNGYPVYSVSYLNEEVVREITIKRPNNRNGVWVDKICNDFEIKSIVTKEQFENGIYKIGE